MVLSPAEARTFYDGFGSKQDAQGFYEDRALCDLAGHAGFDEARRVFELGCGTGRFAARLLAGVLPASATYLGCDLSATMTRLATQRLRPYAVRSWVAQCNGAAGFPVADGSVDRVVATYVLDLLSVAHIEACLHEARRVLRPAGRLCVVSLTNGTTWPSRLVAAAWRLIFRMRPALVGGCRPIELAPYVRAGGWMVDYRNVVVACGVPSEVLIARVVD